MDTLKEFQQSMPHGFDSIAVDIVGFCNAKCKYCPAGNDLTNKGKFIDPALFEQILQKLIEYRFYSHSTNFHIYCIGEPCLHPQINTILRLLSKYNVRTTISTNASIVPAFERDALESVDRFLISVPGFSQSSYDKIHGFDFEIIKKNVIKLRKSVEELSDGRIKFDLSYHIYQFNEAEMVPAKAFCNTYDIRFAPNYAVMLDKDQCLDYVTGDMSFEELKDISKEIFLGVLDQQIKDAPRNYCDFQSRFLSVNADGDIRICSGFHRRKDPDIVIGNLITDHIDEIIWRKYHHPRCEKCIQAGLTLSRGYECKVYPDGYYDIMKENDFILEYLKDEKLQEKLRLLKLVRQYEQEDYKADLKQAIFNHVREYSLQPDIEKIAVSYTRFGLKTYQKIIEK